MATSYLDLTNELLRELNEVTLTSLNFSAAVGVQGHVKDAVNKAYFDVINSEPQWPFLAANLSGETDPMYGNVYVETVAGQRWYNLKPSSSSLTTDYGYVDWDNFYLTTVGVSGETTPYTARNLRFTTIESWKDYRRIPENLDDADTQQYGQRKYVIRSPDYRRFELSPIPDKVYNVHFYAYNAPTALSAFGDTMVLPDQYSNVITARARYYVWQFKESPQQAAFALDDYKKGMRQMKSNLINPAPKYVGDDRRYF